MQRLTVRQVSSYKKSMDYLINKIYNSLSWYNRAVQRWLVSIGSYSQLCIKSLVALIQGKFEGSLVIEQMYINGVMSLPVVAITGFSTGLVLAAQSFFQLSDKGFTDATGIMVAKAMMTELGPILTAFMITGRVGASMCAELGTMKVSEQIDALRSMGVDPMHHLVVPRLAAGLTMMPLLTVFSNAMGILGAYLVSVHVFGMSSASFLDPIPINLKRYELFSGLIKAFVFALLIVSICCYKGLTTRGGAAGVGRATTQSVVICYSLILIVNFMLTLTMNYFYYVLFS